MSQARSLLVNAFSSRDDGRKVSGDSELSNHFLHVLNFLFLAAQSNRKQQRPGCDRFLLLSLIAACRAGFPELADQCRELIIQRNPHHQMNRYSNAIEAMQNEEFQTLAKQLQRFCTSERAEQLAQGLGFHAEQKLQDQENDPSQMALEFLREMHHRTPGTT